MPQLSAKITLKPVVIQHNNPKKPIQIQTWPFVSLFTLTKIIIIAKRYRVVYTELMWMQIGFGVEFGRWKARIWGQYCRKAVRRQSKG